MLSDALIHAELIAPCGLDCGICAAHLRKNRPCPGCRGGDADKLAHCVTCRIRNCAELKQSRASFCGGCAQFPCARLRGLDKRYRSRYKIAPIGNLERIAAVGMEAFIRQEQADWACPRCGGIVCVHTGACVQCGERKSFDKTG